MGDWNSPSLKENMILDETFGIESRELVVAVSEKSDRNFGSINSLRSENSVVNRQISALQKDIKFLQAGLENAQSSNNEQAFSKAELNFKKNVERVIGNVNQMFSSILNLGQFC